MAALFRLVWLSSLSAAIIGIVILLLKAVLKNRISPRWHYIIWAILILKLVFPFGPASQISLLNALPPSAAGVSITQAYQDIHQVVTAQAETVVIPTSGQASKSPGLLPSVPALLPYLWLTGMLILAGWLISTNLLLNIRMKRRSCPAPDAIYALLADCRKRSGVKRDVALMVQDVITTPAIIGPLNPRILLTPSVVALELKDISYIMMHELAHYRRKDLLVNWLLLVLQSIHWFNPVIWYCFHRIRQDMELAADQQVLQTLGGIENREYGKALLAVMEQCSSPQFAPRLIGMVDNKKNIEKRINAIKLSSWFEKQKKLIMVIGSVCVVALGALFLTNAVSNDHQVKSADSDPAAVISQDKIKAIKERVKGFESESKIQGFISGYISTFLRQGYADYYNISQINCRFYSLKVHESQVEAEVMTTMKSRPKNLAKDPDTVPYIKKARVEAENATDPATKISLQAQYEKLKQEYGEEDESNFIFKFTASKNGDEIDGNTVKLLLVNDANPNHKTYTPAEDILPQYR